jgi:hypothetical protein
VIRIAPPASRLIGTDVTEKLHQSKIDSRCSDPQPEAAADFLLLPLNKRNGSLD